MLSFKYRLEYLSLHIFIFLTKPEERFLVFLPLHDYAGGVKPVFFISPLL